MAHEGRSPATVPEDLSHWVQDEKFESLGVPVSVHTSTLTGLRVCVAQVEGPIVSGFFTLATEAVDTEFCRADDGLPHTLEHLIFLGSELFPYKGVLDQLANRCLAGGTNAWTDTDHTAFTLTTAGSDGFLNLMPIYLDHILYPVLSEAGFATEVHHIQGDGTDAGVVYCEIQGRENTCDGLTDRELLNHLYPGSGYSSEANGLMDNVRKLTVEQVRRYHREYYRPDNLCIIVTGQVAPAAILTALSSVEERILSKPKQPPRPRPWSQPVPPLLPASLPESVEVLFPSGDESVGRVLVGWRGPLWSDFEAVTALRVMWLYLTDSSVSPMHRAFVEVSHPLCGSVDFHVGELSTSYHCVALEDARASALRQMRARVLDVIRHEAANIDLARLAAVIARERRNVLNAVESHPHYTFAAAAISHALYGAGHTSSPGSKTTRSLERYMGTLARLDALPSRGHEARAFWSRVMHDRLLATPCVAVMGRPSVQLAREIAVVEASRVRCQREELGPEGLALQAESLRRAVEANEVAPPPGLLQFVPVPQLSSVAAIPVLSVRHWPVHDAQSAADTGAGTGACSAGAGAVDADADGGGGGGGGGEGGTSQRRWHTVESRRSDAGVAWRISAARVGADAYDADAFAEPEVAACKAKANRAPGDQHSRAGGAGAGASAGELAGSVGALPPLSQAVVARLQADRLAAGALPIWLQWDHVNTSFVTVTAALDTQGIPPRLRSLCTVVTASLLELPVRLPSGEVLGHGAVVAGLMADSVATRVSLGVHGGSLQCGAFPQAIVVSLTFEARRYAVAVRWLKRMLLHTKFCADRLKITVNQLLAHIPSLKRSGEVVAQELLRFDLFDGRSNFTATNPVRQQRCLEDLAARLAATPAEVVREMEEFRALMTQPHRMRFHVACDVFRVDRPAAVWVEQFAQAFSDAEPLPLEPVTHVQTLLKPTAGIVPIRGSTGGVTARLVALASSESSYLVQATACIRSFTHPDYPAIMVAIEYLTALEGDFWRNIRGLGLAYSYHIKCSPESGLLRFTLSQCADVVSALEVAGAIVSGYTSGERKLSSVILEATKSSVLFSLVSREATVEQAGFQSFKNALRGVEAGHNQRLAHNVALVSEADVLRVLRQYFRRLFDPATSVMAVSTPAALKGEVAAALEAAGRSVRDVGQLEEWFCADMARRGLARNRSLGGAASPDFVSDFGVGDSGLGHIVAGSGSSDSSSGGSCDHHHGGSVGGTGSGSGGVEQGVTEATRQGHVVTGDVPGRPALPAASTTATTGATSGRSDADGDGGDNGDKGWLDRLSTAAATRVGKVVAVGLAAASLVLVLVLVRRRSTATARRSGSPQPAAGAAPPSLVVDGTATVVR